MVCVTICTIENLRLESNLGYSTIRALPENTLTLGAVTARSKLGPLIGTKASKLGVIVVYALQCAIVRSLVLKRQSFQ